MAKRTNAKTFEVRSSEKHALRTDRGDVVRMRSTLEIDGPSGSSLTAKESGRETAN